MKSNREIELVRSAEVSKVAFLIDVDNTLLDNDRLLQDLERILEGAVGETHTRTFLKCYTDTRIKLGFASWPVAIDQFSKNSESALVAGAIIEILFQLPFEQYLFENSMPTLRFLSDIGETIILTDGDHLYQRLKVHASGLIIGTEGRLLICQNKEKEIDSVRLSFPADHYIIIDDKPEILARMKVELGSNSTTILVRQGKYALDNSTTFTPQPDVIVDDIGGIQQLGYKELVGR